MPLVWGPPRGFAACPTQDPQHHLFTKSCREWCSLLTSSCKLGRKTYLIFQKLCSCLRGSQILQSSILSRPPNAVPVPVWAHTRMSICARASFSWREDRPQRRRCPKFWVHSISFQGRKQSAWTGHMLRPRYYVTVFSKGGKKRRPFEENHVLRAVRHLNVFLSKYLPGHNVSGDMWMNHESDYNPYTWQLKQNTMENLTVFSTSICFRHTPLFLWKWGRSDREQKCSDYSRYLFIEIYSLFCMDIKVINSKIF